MKTPMPEPALPNKRYWIESQLRSAMVAAYEEGVEEAAKECEGMKVRAVRSSYEDAYRHAASAIRKLKEQTP